MAVVPISFTSSPFCSVLAMALVAGGVVPVRGRRSSGPRARVWEDPDSFLPPRTDEDDVTSALPPSARNKVLMFNYPCPREYLPTQEARAQAKVRKPENFTREQILDKVKNALPENADAEVLAWHSCDFR